MAFTIPHSRAAGAYNAGVVAGVILSAGRSSRMGRPKALLPFDAAGTTFMGHLASALRAGGVDEVVAVGRAGDGALRREAAKCAVRYATNTAADEGQLSSVLAGLAAVEERGASAMLLIPVDVPRISGATVSRVIAAWRASHAPVVRAAWQGRHGHPVLFAREVFADLHRADPDVGARAVVRALGERVVNVEVEDPGVVEDIDTPEDYRRLFGRSL